MQLTIKYSPDITIKSKYVRKEMSRRLEQNLNAGLKKFLKKEDFTLQRQFDRLVFTLQNPENSGDHKGMPLQKKIYDVFKFTSGISYFQESEKHHFESFEDAFKIILEKKQDTLKNPENSEKKTFRVSVRRSGYHAFTSVQFEKYIGGGLAQHTGAKVKLKGFDEEVRIEVKDDFFFLLSQKIQGIGGLPLFSEKRVLSLISGGFDSAVSPFLLMRKGAPTDFLFFNLGGLDHETGVQEISHFIADRFSAGYDPNFISIPFMPIIRELMNKKMKPKYRGILLKRCMMRVAEMVCNNMDHQAIITGESLSQVSSQTLQNLKVIENALKEVPLYRPLFGLNKQEIISFTKMMGTEEFSAKMPEYCGVVSDKPSTRAKQADIDYEEAKFPLELLEKVFISRNIEKLSKLKQEEKTPLKTISSLDSFPEISEKPEDFVIIDLREPEVFEEKPLTLKNSEIEILNIPFFEIDEKFPELDQTKQYIFTCSKGVMSQSHSRLLQRKGFNNISIVETKSAQCEI